MRSNSRSGKPNRSKIVKEIDAVCRRIIFIRDEGKCKRCGKSVSGKNAHTSHIIPRSKGMELRFDLINLDLMCYHDHINWWHKNPVEAGEWFKEKNPARWEYLQAHKNDTVKYSISDLLNKKSELEYILKQMEEHNA